MSATTKRVPRVTIARRAVQVVALAFFCVPALLSGLGLLGTFTGVIDKVDTASALPYFGSFSSSTVFGLVVADPYALLQTVFASKDFALGWLLAALPVLVVYGLIRGRAYCGWVCPVNFLMEGVDWLRSKLGFKVLEHAVDRRSKVVIAAVVLLLCALTGTLVFEVFSPISAIGKGILFGSTAGLVVLVAIVVLELFWARRVWCRALCPLGGFYETLGEVGFVSVKMDADACVHCNTCKQVCLCDPVILDGVLEQGAACVQAGDCMLCGKCVDVCPTSALHIGVAAPWHRANPTGDGDNVGNRHRDGAAADVTPGEDGI